LPAAANTSARPVGKKPFRPGQYSELLFKPFTLQGEDDCNEVGWNVEQTLDVEALHGMAPDAKVLYLGAKNCDTGIDDALNFVVNNHLASIVSNSYGWQGEDLPADEIALEHSIFVQAAAEGIGLYFSSGDDGDNVADGIPAQPDYASSDPLVTGVGGTSLLLDKTGNRFAEVGWETTLDFVDYTRAKAKYESPLPGEFDSGAGGGVSTLFAQPWYQQGTVPAKLARSRGGKAMRVAPDIAALGDPYTGFYIGVTIEGQFVIGAIGGASPSCPPIARLHAPAPPGPQVAHGGDEQPTARDTPAGDVVIAGCRGERRAVVEGAQVGTADAGVVDGAVRNHVTEHRGVQRVDQRVGEADRELATLAGQGLDAGDQRAGEAGTADRVDDELTLDGLTDVEPGVRVTHGGDVRRHPHRLAATGLGQLRRYRALLVPGLGEQGADPAATAEVELTRQR